MATQVRETTAEGAPAVALGRPLVLPPAFRLDRRTTGWLAAAGRFGCVWLPLYALAVGGDAGLARALAEVTVAALLWTAALARAFALARLTLLPLGAAPAAALGTATGFAGVAVVSVLAGTPLPAATALKAVVAVFCFAALWEALVHRSLAAERRVLVVGAGDGGADLVRELAWEPTPFAPVGLVDDDELDALPEIVAERRPDIVVLAGAGGPALERLLDVAAHGFKVLSLPEFHEHAFGRVPVATLTPAWFVGVLHLYNRPYARWAKRGFDVAVALAGLAATCWLFPLLAWLVSRTPGPVIFRQTRLGEGGRRFTIYKFRTMRADAEAGGAVWACERDPRVTRVGAFLRKSRLDELPQLWNVLRGDMSIVGPRPERPEFLAELRDAVPFWTRRHLVKPGITGWAQVRRGYTADADGTAEKLAYDLWYLRHRSLLLDAAICVRTFSTLVSGSGAR